MRHACDSMKRVVCGDRSLRTGLRAAMSIVVLAACAGAYGAEQEAPKPADSGFAEASPKEAEMKGLDPIVTVRVNEMDLPQACACCTTPPASTSP